MRSPHILATNIICGDNTLIKKNDSRFYDTAVIFMYTAFYVFGFYRASHPPSTASVKP